MRRRRLHAGLWTVATSVVDLIHHAVPSCDADRTATIEVVHNILTGTTTRVEFILDSPVNANWRLKAGRDGVPRVAYYGRSSERLAVEAALNDRIREAVGR